MFQEYLGPWSHAVSPWALHFRACLAIMPANCGGRWMVPPRSPEVLVMSRTETSAQPHDSERRARLLRLATTASVVTALVLIASKVGAWIMTGSVSLLASLIDSTMDALASAINFVAVRYALQPADDEHRFGHGKAESLAGLGQATFIAGSAGLLFLEAIDRLIHPAPIQSLAVGIEQDREARKHVQLPDVGKHLI